VTGAWKLTWLIRTPRSQPCARRECPGLICSRIRTEGRVAPSNESLTCWQSPSPRTRPGATTKPPSRAESASR